MKQKLFIFMFLILMIAVLVGLNAASYTQKEKTPDSEFSPNRSTFNSGATGTQALYSLLSETGRKVARWQESPSSLLTAKANKPAVFVVTGRLRREFTDVDTEQLLRWVAEGGRLVIIDREPPEELVTTTANWKITVESKVDLDIYNADATDQEQMIGETGAIKPVQPSVYTQNVNAVQPSRFAGTIKFERFLDSGKKGQGNGTGTGTAPPPPRAKPMPTSQNRDDNTDRDILYEASPTPSPNSPKPKPGNNHFYSIPTPTPLKIETLSAVPNVESPSQIAPVVHFAGGGKNLVVDAPFGSGRIVYLSDPYIVSNGGIGLVDNAQLAINLVAVNDGLIAFDEYHQGYGTDNNRFLQFFAGTPVVAIFLQAALLIGFVFFSQSRRFARPVPEPEPDRLSKLEYVAAMAEIQNRTRAFDLAIENIYTDFRRRAARYFGLDNYTAKSGDIAALIAERSGLDRANIEDTLFKCEEIIRGEPTNKREVVRLADALRAIEQTLGMTRAARTRI